MSWYQKLLYGVDLDEEQARQNDLDAQLARENKADLDSGVYDQATFDAAEANRVKSYIGDVEGQVTDEFKKGLTESVDSVRAGVGNVVGLPFRLVPWQLWLIGLAALFVYMGGWMWLRGAFLRK
jgi:hypothetical protein